MGRLSAPPPPPFATAAPGLAAGLQAADPPGPPAPPGPHPCSQPRAQRRHARLGRAVGACRKLHVPPTTREVVGPREGEEAQARQ